MLQNAMYLRYVWAQQTFSIPPLLAQFYYVHVFCVYNRFCRTTNVPVIQTAMCAYYVINKLLPMFKFICAFIIIFPAKR